MGCHGAINGLSVARGLAADPDARVLLVAVELCTLHFGERAQPGAEVAGVLFGDGAAAAAIGGPLRRGDLALTATGSLVLPGTSGLMSWDVGDHGFEMGLSAEVPGEIETRLSAWLEPWLRARGLSIADVGGWAVHPGGTRILDAVEAALSLPKDALRHSREHLAEFGNLSSPTVLFLVERLRAAGMRPPHVLLAFGPGLSAEVALLESVQG
jgi:predicted naringenin-chalcone synthase